MRYEGEIWKRKERDHESELGQTTRMEAAAEEDGKKQESNKTVSWARKEARQEYK